MYSPEIFFIYIRFRHFLLNTNGQRKFICSVYSIDLCKLYFTLYTTIDCLYNTTCCLLWRGTGNIKITHKLPLWCQWGESFSFCAHTPFCAHKLVFNRDINEFGIICNIENLTTYGENLNIWRRRKLTFKDKRRKEKKNICIGQMLP